MKIKFYAPVFCLVFCTALPLPSLVAQSCPGLGSVTLQVVPAPAPTLSAPAQLCTGGTGTVAVNQTFSAYAWNTGESSQSILVDGPGMYVVTVTSAGGCTNSATVNVAPSPPPAPNITQNPYFCNGNITLNAGPGFTAYAWSNGGGNQTATFNSAGLYTVTVTNAQGCTGTDDFDVTIPTPPVADISGNLGLCTGENTTLSANAGFNAYHWSTGSNMASIAVVTGGTYIVTVTDAFGCTDTESATVVTSPSPSPTVANAALCQGASVTLSVSNAPFPGYNWSTGSNTSSTSVTVPGNYTVTVTAVNGCTGTTSANVAFLPSPNPAITQSTYICNGQLTLNAGAGFASYTWSNAASTPTTTVNAAGTYSVTVTNAQGCTGTNSYFADIPAPPVVGITGNNSFCTGASTQLSATAGFNGYVWSNAQSGPNISVSSGGAYTVTATDAFGCTATNSFTVNTLPAPQPVIAGPASVCSGMTATFNTTASFSTYSWSSGQNTPSITAGLAGIYTVTVTANNGCTGTDTQALNVIPSPSPAITVLPYACNNQVTLNTGVGFSSYAWSNGSSLASTSVTVSGNYSVTVTDAQGCTSTDAYLVDVPVAPAVNITGNSSFCPGGSSTLTSTAGFANYVWSTGASNPDISVSTAGNYSVTVSDAFGCTATNVLSVSMLTAPAPNISGPAQICAPGSATFSVPGNFTAFSWSTGDVTSSITVSAANTYTVTVTGVNGCTATDSQSLVVANSLQPQIAQLPYTCNSQLTLDAGTGFASYQWSGGQNTQTINVNTNSNYSVTVSDAGGCTGTAIITAAIPTPPTVAISGPGSICSGDATTLSATAGLSAYVWNNGQVGASISANAGGAYSVTATDAAGCTVTDDFTLTTTPLPQPLITGPGVICTNSSGVLSLSATFSQYSWSTGVATASITVSSGNTYGVTVTDALGCTGTDAQVVTEASSLSPTVTQLPYACNGMLTLDAGAGFAAYLWSGGAQTATFQATATGSYTVTVTDGTGCTGTGSLTVTVPVVSQVVITGKNSFCQNDSTTLVATPGFVDYIWNTGTTSNSVTTMQSGVYSVTVTDNLGCTDTENLQVTAQTLPQPQITGPAAVCAGLSANFSLGQNFTSYLWSDGSTGASTTATTGGLYAVTVTDANGCTGNDGITLTLNPNPVPAIVPETYACDGQITLSASTGANSYSWTGPNAFMANGQQATGSISGTYTVTVTDANGCTGTAAQNTTVPAVTQVALSGPTQFCPGSQAGLAASAGFSGYLWSNGLTQPGITVNAAGLYAVTATDALGCTSTASMAVSEFPAAIPVIAGPSTVCPGHTANLSVGGNFSTFQWSTGANTAGITLQPPATATVTVTDVNGCSGTATAAVTVSNQLTPNIVALPYACDGQITLDAGSGFQNYTWSGGQNTNQIAVAQSGAYTVTVSDGSGCSGTATVQVTVPTPPQVALSGDTQLCPAEVSTLTGTAGFAAYAWNDGSNLSTLQVGAAGTYGLTVTDGLGCQASASLAVLALAAPTPVIAGPASICGSNPISLNVTGSAFSNILWSTTATTPAISITVPGAYSVTVTDANGCTGTAQTAVQTGNSLSASIAQLPYACNGQLTLDAGAGFASYLWSNGENQQTVTTTQPGTYTVTVTATGSCSGTATTQVSLPANPLATISGGLSFCAGSNTTLSVGASFSTYAWSNGSIQAATTVDQAGNYTVTVTDQQGCTATDSATVTGGLPVTTTLHRETCRLPEAGTQTLTLSTLNGCDSLVTIITTYHQPAGLALDLSPVLETQSGQELILNVTGNFPIDSVAFSSPYTLSCTNCLQPTLTATASGSILVMAFDANGCGSSEEIQIVVRKRLDIYVPNAFQPGSVENGFFTVFSGPEISAVRNFSVFDRWGNALFSRPDLPTNDPSAGWDGKFRDQNMQPGVYIYYFEVTLVDGSMEVFNGDVTIAQ